MITRMSHVVQGALHSWASPEKAAAATDDMPAAISRCMRTVCCEHREQTVRPRGGVAERLACKHSYSCLTGWGWRRGRGWAQGEGDARHPLTQGTVGDLDSVMQLIDVVDKAEKANRFVSLKFSNTYK